ncbi:MAG: DUF4097 family beta strand repeat-containing protein [Gemmatimonadaceae bacterium]
MRAMIRAVFAVALLAPSLSAQELLGRSESVFSITERLADGGAVRIYSRMGDINITEGSGSTVEYRAEKVPRRGKVDDIAFQVIRGSNGVTICAVYTDEDNSCDADGLRNRRNGWRDGSRDRASVNVTVKVPRRALLRSSTVNGDLSVAAAVAEAHASSGNGKVRVVGVTGRVEASSGNGDITVENAGGPVRASSGSGDVRVTAVNGPVNASSGNGSILASMDKLSSDGDLEFSTGNGRIEVVLPANFSAEVEASSGNGKVATDFPITIMGRLTPSRLRGTIGDGGRRLRMSTGNGSLAIRKQP